MEQTSLRNIRVKLSPAEDIREIFTAETPKSRHYRVLRRGIRLVISRIRQNVLWVIPLSLVGFLVSILIFGGERVSQAELKISSSGVSWQGGPSRPFVYVYNVGEEFTDRIRLKSPAFYSTVYDAEKLFLEFRHFETEDPEKAHLFYVPFFSAFYTSSLYRDWEVNMASAVKETSELWGKLLSKIRAEHPYFNRSNGADHFSVLSMDHGRCSALTFLNPEAYGEMFFLQHNGDKAVRSCHSHPIRNLQILGYNYGQNVSTEVPDIPCYRPDRDIVIPPPLEGSTSYTMATSRPVPGNRTIFVLFPFKPLHHHGLPVLHSNHDIRAEIYELAQRKFLGWAFEPDLDEDTMRANMRSSVFCACPPGHSQWTSRFFKAVLAGCIPVTFFRDNDLPWQGILDYSKFSVNVDPADISLLHETLVSVSQAQLSQMQRALLEVQPFFRWDQSSKVGVEFLTARSLWGKAKKQRGF